VKSRSVEFYDIRVVLDDRQIQTMDDFWDWLNYTAVPSLRSDNWYNNRRPVGTRGFLGDTVSRLMGFATLRQLRVKKG